jgi:hypothetical protein
MKMAVVNKVSGDELYVAKDDQWELLDIAGGDDTIAFADLPTGTTSNTVAIGNHSHTLDNLSDVVITSPAVGHTISFNGSNWINQVASGDGDNVQFATVLPSSPAAGKTIYVISKSSPDRTLTYVWNGSWQLISYTNIADYYGTDSPSVTGDAVGQVLINLSTTPSTIYNWDSTQWQQIYP